ncbi:MAG: hypothetical protein CBD58_00495 [bacterium TMED198]|nr:MAG: hypothetical protein CBD58_00495 [bacterium TMED198]|tara:strand:- start:1339 stop:2382 length:1044 start_codon:yes stop_codon:yes gene_type:complete
MKKATVMLLTLGTFVMASQQRVDALGGNPGFWPGDEANVALFPQKVNNYNIAQFGGVGTDGGNTGWVSWGQDTKYGFSWADGADNNMVNMYWGNGAMGVNFGLGMYGMDNGAAGDANVATSGMDINFGWGQDMGFGEVGVTFANGSYDDGSEVTEHDPATMDLGFSLRRDQAFWMFDKMLVNFAMDTYNCDGDCTSGNEFATTDMGLGVSFFTHMDVNESTKAMFAMGFGYGSSANDGFVEGAASSMITLPAFTFGVESALWDFATVRVGATKNYIISSSYQADADADASTMQGGLPFDINFGCGFNYGNFGIDLTVSEGLFNDPVKYANGRNDDALSSSATLTYTW